MKESQWHQQRGCVNPNRSKASCSIVWGLEVLKKNSEHPGTRMAMVTVLTRTKYSHRMCTRCLHWDSECFPEHLESWLWKFTFMVYRGIGELIGVYEGNDILLVRSYFGNVGIHNHIVTKKQWLVNQILTYWYGNPVSIANCDIYLFELYRLKQSDL